MPPPWLASGSSAFGWWILDVTCLEPSTTDGPEDEMRAYRAVKAYTEAESLDQSAKGTHEHGRWNAAVEKYIECVNEILGDCDDDAEGASHSGSEDENNTGGLPCLDLEHDEWNLCPTGVPLGLILANAYNNAGGLLQAQCASASNTDLLLRQQAMDMYSHAASVWSLNEYALPLLNAASLKRQVRDTQTNSR
jgi:hypothetical protein